MPNWFMKKKFPWDQPSYRKQSWSLTTTPLKLPLSYQLDHSQSFYRIKHRLLFDAVKFCVHNAGGTSRKWEFKEHFKNYTLPYAKSDGQWQPRGLGWGGKEVQEGGTYIYLWLIHVDVWKKPTQCCITIIHQLEINLKNKEYMYTYNWTTLLYSIN